MLGQAIATSPPNAVIRLSKGVFYEESLIIQKNLIIQGLGREQTLIKQYAEVDSFFLRISSGSDVKIQAQLENLTIESPLTNGIQIMDKAHITVINTIIRSKGGTGLIGKGFSTVILEDSAVFAGGGGVSIDDSTTIKLFNSNVSASTLSGGIGIKIFSNSIAILENCQILGHESGLVVGGSASVSIKNCQISKALHFGIFAQGRTRLSVINSSISNNGYEIGYGIGGIEWAVLDFSNVIISNNRQSGLLVSGSATATVQGSTIRGNGTALDCRQLGPEFNQICNGVMVDNNAQVVIADTLITDNTDWGIAAKLKRCGYYEDNFAGKIVFTGEIKSKGIINRATKMAKGTREIILSKTYQMDKFVCHKLMLC